MKEYNKCYQLAKEFRKSTPSREEQERVVVNIEQLANSAGVKLRSCKMAEEPKAVEGMPAYRFTPGRSPAEAVTCRWIVLWLYWTGRTG